MYDLRVAKSESIPEASPTCISQRFVGYGLVKFIAGKVVFDRVESSEAKIVVLYSLP